MKATPDRKNRDQRSRPLVDEELTENNAFSRRESFLRRLFAMERLRDGGPPEDERREMGGCIGCLRADGNDGGRSQLRAYRRRPISRRHVAVARVRAGSRSSRH